MDRNKIAIIFFFWISVLGSFAFSADSPPPFRFHLKIEPHSLDPTKAISGEHNYLHATLFRGLTRYTDEGLLIFDQAQSCRYIIATDIRCKLRSDLKYSDGSPVTPQDFVDAFKKYVTADGAPYVLPLLLNIKNAKKIYQKELSADTFGMKVSGEREITFLLENPDRDFLEKLSSPLLVPYKNDSVFNGPYQVDKIEKGKRWYLKTNPYFKNGNKDRPPIEIVFADDDETAANLYEKGLIDFLWRIPAADIPKFKSRPDFMQVPVSRLDYVGFNMRPGHPLQDKSLRKLLVESVDFDELKNILFALGRPGCPGYSDRFLLDDPKRCQEFKVKMGSGFKFPSLKFYFSLLGGDDVQRQVQWFQHQWKKNLGIMVQLKGLDQKFYISELSSHPPDIFRKGLGLNRPSCLAGLEFFKSDHPENFTGFKSKKFDDMILPLERQKLSRNEQNIICGAATDFLFKEEYVGIPMGRVHFSMLLRQDFKGVKINELNQLDLSELKYEKK